MKYSNYVREVKKVSVADLTKEELLQIHEINTQNTINNGGTLSISNIMFYMENKDYIVIAYGKNDNEILGYACMKNAIDYTIEFWHGAAGYINDKTISWEQYMKNPNCSYICQMAIRKEFHSMGVGSEILNMLCSNPNAVVLSNARCTNEISIKLHKKFRFELVGGSYRQKVVGDIKDYHSCLFCRKEL